MGIIIGHCQKRTEKNSRIEISLGKGDRKLPLLDLGFPIGIIIFNMSLKRQ
jgi:hypothetical protein